MHNLKDLRKNLDTLQKKFKDRNVDFDSEDFNKKDLLNRDLISKKEKLEQEKKSLSKSKDQINFSKSKKISDEISILIKKQKNYVYTTSAKLPGRPLGKRNVLARRKWIWIRDQYFKLKKKKVADTTEEFAILIRSQLFKEKPEFWGKNIYTLERMKDLIKKQKWE